MIENRPSATALRVAMHRAAHQLLDHPPVLNDPVALRILGPERESELRANPAAAQRGPLSRYRRAFFAARSRFAEDALADAVRRGVGQYVILGAGLDTFGYRSPYADAVRVYEVDHPATQGWKRELLRAAGIDSPQGVVHVPVDFERQSLAEELTGAGMREDQPAFFSWLGVTPYLTRDAAMSTLSYAARAAKPSGGIVFDYSIHPSAMGWLQRMVFNRMARRVKAAGEPMQTFFEPAALAADLTAMGFTEIEDLTADDINARYFAGRRDRLRIGGPGHLIRASVG